MSPGNAVGLKSGEKFSGAGFYAWQFKMKMGLMQQEVWFCIEPEEEEQSDGKGKVDLVDLKRKEQLAYTYIMLSLSDTVQSVVRRCKTAKETWKLLEMKYGGKDLKDRIEIRQRLRNMKLSKSDYMINHLAKIQDCVDQLSAAGSDIDEEEIILSILESLPKEYDVVKVALSTREKGVSQDELHSILLAEERRLRASDIKNETESVYSASRKSNSDAKTRTCYTCGKYGHISKFCKETIAIDGRLLCRICQSNQHLERQCPRNAKPGRKQPGSNYYYKSSRNDNKTALSYDNSVSTKERLFYANKFEDYGYVNKNMSLTTNSTNYNDTWLLDPGASNHMSRNNSKIVNYEEREASITTADGNCIQANGTADINLNVQTDKQKRVIRLNDVLISDELETNLLSVAKLTDNGSEVYFFDDKAEVRKKNEVIFTATKRKGLYVIDTFDEVAFNVERSNFSRQKYWKGGDINLWHKRLGHVSEEVIKQTIPIGGKVEKCEECLMSKSDRKPFDDKIKRETYKLQRIYSDVCGPMDEATFGGCKYFVSFVDGFSRYAKIYLLQTKDEVFDKFQDYRTLMQNQTGERIRILRSDNGGEYRNKNFEDFCKRNGIRMEFTSPYSSQQNGLGERYNRSIMNMVRTMLIAAELEKAYWGEATATAVFLKNRLASKVLQWKSPYEIFTDEKPKMENLKVFGSIGYARIADQHRRKLDDRGRKAMLVGYDETSKNYRLVSWNDRSILRSRDVNFVETIMGGYNDNDCSDEQLSEINDIAPPGQLPELPKVAQEQNESEIEEVFEDAVENIPETGESTRSGRHIRKPKRFDDYVSLTTISRTVEEPKDFYDALTRENKEDWLNSMNIEMQILQKNSSWELVDRPRDRNILGCKWVFKLKKDNEGNIIKYKSRLVAKGYNQKFGEDYLETYAPVGDYSTLRCLLAVASTMKLKLTHLDFECAYLNGVLNDDEQIFMELPPGFFEEERSSRKVLKLKKCIYGLKQAGRNWNDTLNNVLKSAGLKQESVDKCLYTHFNNGKTTLVLLYVDDIAIASNDDYYVEKLKRELGSKFVMKDLGTIKSFLGLKIEQDDYKITLSQENIILETIKKYGMESCKSVKTPVESTGVIYQDDLEPLGKDYPYRAVIGSLNYIALVSRPDISYATNILSRKLEKPTIKDWRAAKRVLRYLKGTSNYKICYNKSQDINIKMFTDSDFAGNDDRKSTSGFIALLNNAPITWYSRRQQVVALSTMEAEYVALASATQEGLYLQQVLNAMNIKFTMKVCVDNQSCLSFASNGKVPGRNAKHISIKFHFIKDLVEKGKLSLEYVASEDNVADIFTKVLANQKMQMALKKLGYMNCIAR